MPEFMNEDCMPGPIVDQAKVKAKWRMHELLAAHAMATDSKLTDAQFVTEVVRRWARESGHILSIGVIHER